MKIGLSSACLIALSLVLSCVDETEVNGETRAQRSEHFVAEYPDHLYSQDMVEWSLENKELQLLRLEKEWGFELSREITLSHMEESSWKAGQANYSQNLIEEIPELAFSDNAHELVHHMAFELATGVPPLYGEGLAEWFSRPDSVHLAVVCGWPLGVHEESLPQTPSPEISDNATSRLGDLDHSLFEENPGTLPAEADFPRALEGWSFGAQQTFYGEAALWVRYLIEVWGWSRFQEFYRLLDDHTPTQAALSIGEDLDHWSQAFLNHHWEQKMTLPFCLSKEMTW